MYDFSTEGITLMRIQCREEAFDKDTNLSPKQQEVNCNDNHFSRPEAQTHVEQKCILRPLLEEKRRIHKKEKWVEYVMCY